MADKKKVAVALGVVGVTAGVLLLTTRAAAAIKYPPWIPPVGELPAPPPPEIDEPPVLPPDEPAPPPDEVLYKIHFSMLIVSPSEVILGENVEISVKATNITDSPKSYTLYLGPDTGITEEVSLASAEQITYTWPFTPTKLGIHEVWAGTLHNMFEVIAEPREPGPEPPPETPDVNGDIVYTVAGWVVYDDWAGRGRVYRWGASWSVVEYWLEGDGLHRTQLIGTTPFGVWPEHYVFEVGTLRYDSYSAMFTYMDDGNPEGYKSHGWWSDEIRYCRAQVRPEEAGEHKFCKYSPYTWGEPMTTEEEIRLLELRIRDATGKVLKYRMEYKNALNELSWAQQGQWGFLPEGQPHQSIAYYKEQVDKFGALLEEWGAILATDEARLAELEAM
ncbi:MAG: hypothetical protein KAR06_02930 [Deltaproteobacteria bacterium]|nr:hypothetical protein [Deltaproteobacteria bacterium]